MAILDTGGGGGVTQTVDTYSPTITFSTPGDLSVSYTNQSGFYIKTGDYLYCIIRVSFTPTYTTASGTLRISLPFQAATFTGAGNYSVARLINNFANLTAGANSYAVVDTGNSYATVVHEISTTTGVTTASISTTNVPSGTAKNMYLTLAYQTV